jgi:L-gulonolactone oxidase
VTDNRDIIASEDHLSWGRVIRSTHKVWSPVFRDQLSTAALAKLPAPFLAYGLGRSYGDTCLNPDQTLIDFHRLDRIISADWESGVVRADAGLSLDKLLQIAVPKGWFLPVTPGTKYVTLGGAVANDVHGKDHHKSGSFGHHVSALGLLRSDQTGMQTVKPTDDLFACTVGGLGLSGLISWVELQLKPIKSAYLDVEDLRFADLVGYFDLVEKSKNYDYTVSWLDCTSAGTRAGRGIFSRANFSDDGGLTVHKTEQKLAMPFDMPSLLLNKWSVSAFNSLYYGLNARRTPSRRHYDGFFYPLDAIADWNKMYGACGFYQYQCVIPLAESHAGVSSLLDRIQQSGAGSFLTVLKTFGDKPSLGKLSFPGPGVTLALDFANRGKETLALLADLDRITMEFGGRNYAAKDGRLSGELFRAQYPSWPDVEMARDPKIMSAFWARVIDA